MNKDDTKYWQIVGAFMKPHEYESWAGVNCRICVQPYADPIHTTVEKGCCSKCDVGAMMGLKSRCGDSICPCHTSQKEEGWDVETLSAKLHDIYQTEAHRQEELGLGPARHYDEYEKLSEPVKEFDRVLARYIIELLAKEREEAYLAGFTKAKDQSIGFAVTAGRQCVLTQLREAVEKKLIKEPWADSEYGENKALQDILAEISKLTT